MPLKFDNHIMFVYYIITSSINDSSVDQGYLLSKQYSREASSNVNIVGST